MTAPSQLSLGLRPHVLQGLVILIASFWIYSPAFNGGWLWDDNVLITANPLMTDPHGWWKIWFEPGYSPDYYPLTASVQRLEWNLWGMETRGYHLVNVALHVISAFLVWRLFAQLGLRLAWLGGLLFAIHPVQVESVAWIAELKNALSMPFFLCATCAWIDYDRMGKSRDYFLALGLFLAALLGKITVVMFPLVILLYAWWRRGRVGWRDLKVSAPFFALSLAVGSIPIFTGVWDRVFNHLGPDFVPEGGALARFVLAGLEFSFYFSKSLLPVGLLTIYPKWTVDPFSPLQYLPWLVLAALLLWFWTRRETWGRHALLGVGFFLINLLPCPGFIPSPNMGYAWVMDHFLYLPVIGLIGLAVAAIDVLPSPRSILARGAAIGATVAAVTVLAWGSHEMARLYRDSRTLWTYNEQRNPASWVVQMSLGEVDRQEGKFPEAIDRFQTALALYPRYVGIRDDLADTLAQAGRLDEAIAQYQLVANVAPDYHDVSYALGTTLIAAQRVPEATQCFEAILQRNPHHAGAHAALGNILLAEGKTADAMEQFAQAEASDPGNAQLHFTVGTALMRANRLPDALAEYQQAVALNPRDLDVLANLGVALARMGRIPEAARQFQAMLQIDPDSAAAYTNLGSLFLMVGKFPEAIAQYQEALRRNPDFAEAQKDLVRAEAMQKAHSPP